MNLIAYWDIVFHYNGNWFAYLETQWLSTCVLWLEALPVDRSNWRLTFKIMDWDQQINRRYDSTSCHSWLPCQWSEPSRSWYLPPLVGDRLPAKYAVVACRNVCSCCAQFVSRLKQRNMYQLLLYQSTLDGNIITYFGVRKRVASLRIVLKLHRCFGFLIVSF